jgi:oxygen-independent coproporphyrinogen-3 oxidase
VPHVGDFEDSFVDALIQEFTAAVEEIDETFCCPTVFFGGGTPSVLRTESLDRIFAAVLPYLPKENDSEITFEANPEDVTYELLHRLRTRGVNRLSLGVQSMDPDALRVLKRCSAEVNARAIDLVGHHFENFSVDLLLGTPAGTVEDIKDTLEVVGGCQPPHFSVYCLEPGGVMESETSDFFGRVDPERAAEEYLYICEMLRERGYVHYEISNFASPGCESQHNRVYWSGGEYLGIGPGAHSYIDGERFYNEPSIERYVSAAGRLPGALRRFEPRGSSERRLEEHMLALRTARGLPVDRVACPTSVVDQLIEDDLADMAADRLVLTDRGYLVLNEILLRLSNAD